MKNTRTFVGFGFGPIQSGLFLYEAARSGAFKRFVVSEVVAETVEGLRRAGGRYSLNVAAVNGVETHEVAGVEMLNPMTPADREVLVEAVAEAHELATALPSVEFFDRGVASVARLLADGLALKVRRGGPACVIYAAENHNHAAEILKEKVQAHVGNLDLSRHAQFLNTVIGKMSQVLANPAEGGGVKLVPMTPDMPKTILVEAFNRILISRITLPGFQRGLTMLAEKDDLLPFEEAKLYGHNATHALLGYLAHERGLEYMSDAAGDASLMSLVRDAFLIESGGAMLARHRGIDDLFTEAGYRAYVDDLMIRMVNPYLRDRVDRIIRDPRRKLGWDDRLVGTMRRVLEAGIEPERYARGAKAALTLLKREHPGEDGRALLTDLWVREGGAPADAAKALIERIAV